LPEHPVPAFLLVHRKSRGVETPLIVAVADIKSVQPRGARADPNDKSGGGVRLLTTHGIYDGIVEGFTGFEVILGAMRVRG
jgi:hypothetical protein